MVFRNVCDFIDRFTGYKKSSKISTVHKMYSLLMSWATSANWRRGWSNEELTAFSVEVCKWKEEVLDLITLVYASGVYVMKFHLRDHETEGIWRSKYIFFFDSSVYEQYNAQIKTTCRKMSKTWETSIQETAKLMEQHRSGKPATISSDVRSNLQGLVCTSARKLHRVLGWNFKRCCKGIESRTTKRERENTIQSIFKALRWGTGWSVERETTRLGVFIVFTNHSSV